MLELQFSLVFAPFNKDSIIIRELDFFPLGDPLAGSVRFQRLRCVQSAEEK